MTHKMFWHDPYLTHLDTHVTTVNGADIAVAATIFYAFAGGQESDAGTIGGYPVLRAHKTDENAHEIVYTLPDDHSLRVGDAVTMVIDWERRYRLMRLHFAAEIILELYYQHFSPITKIGAHIAQDKARIDFEWGENIAGTFPLILNQAHSLIHADLPIVSSFSDPANERRTWEVAGFGKVACGGTHLRRTGEVGTLTLKRKNIGKGKERVEIFVEDEPRSVVGADKDG